MIYTIARVALWCLVVLATGCGRLLAPARQLNIVHNFGLYGTRHWSHFHAYVASPGWLFIEMGSWTVEATWRTRSEMSRLKFTA
jgi:hypothetical protein